MHVFGSRVSFDGDLGWRIRARVGVEWLELDADQLRRREPDLHPRYTFGVVVENPAVAAIPAPTSPHSPVMPWHAAQNWCVSGRPA